MRFVICWLEKKYDDIFYRNRERGLKSFMIFILQKKMHYPWHVVRIQGVVGLFQDSSTVSSKTTHQREIWAFGFELYYF